MKKKGLSHLLPKTEKRRQLFAVCRAEGSILPLSGAAEPCGLGSPRGQEDLSFLYSARQSLADFILIESFVFLS
ncbi:MAG: hypothetical protein J6V24_06420, partial [Clostridia bacterium]|nr:hypothetical protein [Clostridia bacterium]